MKTRETNKNLMDVFSAEVLSEKQMRLVVGGTRPRPKSRDKDIFDIDVDN